VPGPDRHGAAHPARSERRRFAATPPAATLHCDTRRVTGYVRIDIAELRLACNKVLDVVAERLGPEVVLGDGSFVGDHYWELTLEASFGLVDHPELHVVAGQTTDDVDELRRIIDSEDVVLWHDIAHITGVLRRIASLDLRETGADGTDRD
jgi:hypothetical protein